MTYVKTVAVDFDGGQPLDSAPVTTPPIPPAAMIEAVAAQLAREWTADSNGVSPTDSWASPPVPPSLEENWRERYREAARRVLGAALSVCSEVREQEGLRLDWVDQNGGQAEDWENNRSGWARNAVRLHQHCEATRPDYPARASLIRRLVITSPAEQVDTEGAT